MWQAFCLFKVEEFFKFFIQCDAQDKCQFRGRAELAGFNGTDGIAGHTYRFRKLRLGESGTHPRLLDMVSQYKFFPHDYNPIARNTVSMTVNTVVTTAPIQYPAFFSPAAYTHRSVETMIP